MNSPPTEIRNHDSTIERPSHGELVTDAAAPKPAADPALAGPAAGTSSGGIDAPNGGSAASSAPSGAVATASEPSATKEGTDVNSEATTVLPTDASAATKQALQSDTEKPKEDESADHASPLVASAVPGRIPTPSSRTSTPPAATATKKKFSSVSVNKEFLSKAASPVPAPAKLGVYRWHV